MVIDKPGFYFTANKVKHWLLIIALVSFVLSLIIATYNVQAAAIFIFIVILALVIYLILWFIT